MLSFFICLSLLIIGYFVYGFVLDKLFGIDEKRVTPAIAKEDKIDYVPMPTWKAFLLQLLNIAGLGPIFGAVSGALWGPQVFIWITLGSIFAGGVHDFIGGLLSVRNDGCTVSEFCGKYQGKVMLYFMRIISVILLIMIGVVFMVGPAQLLSYLTSDKLNINFWTVVILLYFFVATLFPIDKIIGVFYPFFGAILIFMAIGIIIGIFTKGLTIPEISFTNLHPQKNPIFPFMFVTVACGAISGFHSTQSTLMARCIKNEKDGKKVFFGAMISEGIIALIWAAAGCSFYKDTQGLFNALSLYGGSQSGVVYEISTGLLGKFGGLLAMIGVILCPITSGDTAYRSARLTIAEWTKLDQSKTKNRLLITIPLLVTGLLISFCDYNVIWRYFSWTNQMLAMVVLWCASVYLFQEGKYKFSFLVTIIPAIYMTMVCATYILMADEGLKLNKSISLVISGIFTLIAFCIFLISIRKNSTLHKKIIHQ